MFGLSPNRSNLQARAHEVEREVLAKVRRGDRVARNIAVENELRLTVGDRLADRFATFAGSWTFIIGFFLFMLVWIGLNVLALFAPWDEYPFILLNLMLSMTAAVQAPLILMSQNRQEIRDRASAQHDYEVNLKAELEIQELRGNLDALRDQHLKDLADRQAEQNVLLRTLLARLGGSTGGD